MAWAADLAAMRLRLDMLREGAQEAEASGALWSWLTRLPRELPSVPPRVRCAFAAATLADVLEGIDACERTLAERPAPVVREGRAFVGLGAEARIGFVFPGQGAPVRTAAGALGERVPEAAEAFAAAGLPSDPADVPDELVQLSVVASSLSALAALRALGVEATVAVGHSLGELTALHWAGAIDADLLLRLARARGRAMTAHGGSRGAMASVRADDEQIAALTEGLAVSVACFNSPRQRVVSGEASAVESVVVRARKSGLRAVRLPVVGAFHSPLMRPAVTAFERDLARERLGSPRRPVASTVTGGILAPDADLCRLLSDQIMAPVRFAEALESVAARADLLLEVGPGRVLSAPIADVTDMPVVATRAGDLSSEGLVEAAAGAFAAGARLAIGRLTGGPAALDGAAGA